MEWVDIFFPGVWVHEFSHVIGCWISGATVHHVEVKRHSGKVVHEQSNVRGSIIIGFFPLMIGGILAFLLFESGKTILSTEMGIYPIALMWLGGGIAFHSIPSHQDIQNIPRTVTTRMNQLWGGSTHILWKLGKTPLYGIIWVGGILLSLLAWGVNQTILFRLAWMASIAWVA